MPKTKRRAKTDSLTGPSLDKGARSWLFTTARSHHWRVGRWIELEDLIQDGFLCYAKVRAYYPGLHSAQTMALFKATYINHLHDLAKRRLRMASEIAFHELQEGLLPRILERQPDPFAELLMWVGEQTPWMRETLHRVLADPSQLLPIRGVGRETMHQCLCRILGVEIDDRMYNLHEALIEALRP